MDSRALFVSGFHVNWLCLWPLREWNSQGFSLPVPSKPYFLLCPFLTSYRWCRSRNPDLAVPWCRAIWFVRLLGRFVLFCFSLKHKDAPNLWQDCTSLCPNNHETAWETEILSPCPLPLLLKNCHTVQGLFRSWGGAMPTENSPSLGLLDVWILKIYIRSEKSNVRKGRLRLCF